MLLNLHSQELRGSYKGSSCVQDVFLKERLMARAKRCDALTQTLSLNVNLIKTFSILKSTGLPTPSQSKVPASPDVDGSLFAKNTQTAKGDQSPHKTDQTQKKSRYGH